MKKMYNVELRIDAVVLAESSEHAEEITLKNKHKILDECYPIVDASLDFSYLPDGWSWEDTPYGGELSVGEYVIKGAGPRFVQLNQPCRIEGPIREFPNEELDPE